MKCPWMSCHLDTTFILPLTQTQEILGSQFVLIPNLCRSVQPFPRIFNYVDPYLPIRNKKDPENCWIRIQFGLGSIPLLLTIFGKDLQAGTGRYYGINTLFIAITTCGILRMVALKKTGRNQSIKPVFQDEWARVVWESVPDMGAWRKADTAAATKPESEILEKNTSTT